MVIIVGNGRSGQNLNSERGCLHCVNTHGNIINPTPLPQCLDRG